MVHSFAGDPFGLCAQHLGIEAAAPLQLDRSMSDRLKRERQAETRRRELKALSFCERLWNGAEPVEGGPGAAYFQARAIGWFPNDLRYHRAAPRGYSSPATAPAILALARSFTGSPRAVQATFLARDCRSKTGRITFGKLLGSTVRLSPPTETLAVAEGMETAAAYCKLEAIPTWAALGTANLEAFQPPAGVRQLIVAADGDAAGVRAARALAERVCARCEVIIRPAPDGFDWNDVATGRVHV